MKANRFFMGQIEKDSLLTVENEKELIKKAWEGDRAARNKLVTSNLRFVIKIATKYRNRGLSFEDLISAGCEGLIIAASKFNPSKDNRFITYAVWWIRQSIQKALLETSRNVRLPMNRKDELMSSKWNMASLDVAYGDENDGETFGNSISDSRVRNPEESYIQKETNSSITKGISSLTEKEQMVIKMRYGFGGEEKSLADIGKILNFSKEGVRQIEKKAIRKLHDDIRLSA